MSPEFRIGFRQRLAIVLRETKHGRPLEAEQGRFLLSPVRLPRLYDGERMVKDISPFRT
jgi:hypothetical protein